MQITLETLLSDLAIPEIEVVLAEKCGILPQSFSGPLPKTVRDVATRTHLQPNELLKRLQKTCGHCEAISQARTLSEIQAASQLANKLVLICDIETNKDWLQKFPLAVSTARRDWEGIWQKVREVGEVICIGKNQGRAFSTALGLRELGYKNSLYVPLISED